MKLRYTVIDPTKNITLLVTTPVERPLQPQVAGWLLRHEKDAEQVAFLEQGENGPRLQMMGGEFCGNAAMGLAAWLAREEDMGETQNLLLELSGAAEPVPCAITPVRTCCIGTVTMPLPLEIGQRDFPLSDGSVTLPVVVFSGIAHIIAPIGTVARASAEEALRYWSALLPTEAVGMLLWDEGAARFDPLVYVKATQTAIWEKSCASGTAALGAWLAAQRRQDCCRTVKQPGGAIAVVARWQERLTSLTVSGTVALRADRTAEVVF